MPESIINSMFIGTVDQSEVNATANKLKSKLSHGHDDISTKLLKNTITNILQPITHIINVSFNTGVVSQEMKIAKVIPIHKSAHQSLLKNYRPVSIFPAFQNCLKKIMYKKIISYLNSHNILFKHQYGFRTKHSTIHPIIHLLNSSNKNNYIRNTRYSKSMV